MSEITKPIILDETGQAIKTQLAANNPSSQLNAIAQNLALIATSSNAAQTLAQLAKTIADEANSIAKGATVAQVFDTEALMTAWIKNSANKGKLKVGDNLYIKAVDVPDYWVSAVLQNPNASGAYYEVSKLETGKVDLNDVVSASSDTDTTIDYAYGQHGNVSKRISAANLASVVAGNIMGSSTIFEGTLFKGKWDKSVDWDTYTKNGIYTFEPENTLLQMSHLPSTIWGVLEVFCGSNYYIFQRATGTDGNLSNVSIYVRVTVDGGNNWGNWNKVI